jgi:hypothetical protein
MYFKYVGQIIVELARDIQTVGLHGVLRQFTPPLPGPCFLLLSFDAVQDRYRRWLHTLSARLPYGLMRLSLRRQTPSLSSA